MSGGDSDCKQASTHKTQMCSLEEHLKSLDQPRTEFASDRAIACLGTVPPPARQACVKEDFRMLSQTALRSSTFLTFIHLLVSSIYYDIRWQKPHRSSHDGDVKAFEGPGAAGA